MEARALRLLLAFAAVYLLWGSTYLAIRIVVETLPPALSAGLRFFVAGSLMLAYAFWRGGRLPRTAADWMRIAIAGVALLVAGNGLVTWAERWVPSNQAALVVATAALWMALLGTLGLQGDRLGRLTVAGLVGGLIGVALLVGGGLRGGTAPWFAYAGLLLAPMFWAAGAVFAKRRPVAASPIMAAALQTLIAGVVLSIVGLAAGELPQMIWNPRSFAALAYLIVFGSCIAYGAFLYLVHEVSPAVLGTYAYVNPAIALLLGWWLLDERLMPAQIVGTAVVLLSVLLVTLGGARRKPHA